MPTLTNSSRFVRLALLYGARKWLFMESSHELLLPVSIVIMITTLLIVQLHCNQSFSLREPPGTNASNEP